MSRVRGHDGRLHLMRTAKDAFLVKEWLAADADARRRPTPRSPTASPAMTPAAWWQMADGGFVAQALARRCAGR